MSKAYIFDDLNQRRLELLLQRWVLTLDLQPVVLILFRDPPLFELLIHIHIINLVLLDPCLLRRRNRLNLLINLLRHALINIVLLLLISL